ncbi:glutamate ABC transporter substrate-binding protein [Nocardia sp. NPDC050710]|uniref:glutamate ABC transporter substrate-binding protein n=1 Tax=Nocardia sp. NPDC050710 TaxID=3157220 RepID=UPI0033D17D46
MIKRFRPGWAILLAATAACACSCDAGPATPTELTVAAVRPVPPGAAEITAAPRQRGDQSCDATASLRPGSLPAPGAMPAGSPMASIVANGRVRVGVDQGSYMFGFRNPKTGVLEGFDIDLAREIARALFGDPDRIELQPMSSAQRIGALRDNKVDLVVSTFSATCERAKEIDFSTVYYISEQRLLVTKYSGLRSVTDLGGKRTCSVHGTTSLEPLFALAARPTVIGMTTWTDCLAALQQGQVDAVSTDAPILFGLAAQDDNLEVVGGALANDAYAIGIQQGKPELVRFVNAVLERIRGDGTWQRLYETRLALLGPSPGPPVPKYVG